MASRPSSRSQDRNFNGPHWTWFQIAVVALVLVAGLAVSLVIVAAIQGADALSTVALALAVVAFTTQILVFVADAWTTSKLNSETHGLLKELRTRAQGTERTLNRQVEKLTDHLFQNVGSELKTPDENPERLRQRIMDDVREVLSEALPEQRYEPPDSPPAHEEPQITEESSRILQELASLPDEAAGIEALAAMDRLTPMAVATLKDFARDEKSSRAYGAEPGMYLRADHPFTDELVEQGLVRIFGPDDDGNELGGLTDEGRKVARVMLAPMVLDDQDLPGWLKQHRS